MKTYQTVQWYEMPQEMKDFIRKSFGYFGHSTFHEWDPLGWEEYQPGEPEYEEWFEDMKMIEKINSYLKKQKCNLKKPILILVDW